MTFRPEKNLKDILLSKEQHDERTYFTCPRKRKSFRRNNANCLLTLNVCNL